MQSKKYQGHGKSEEEFFKQKLIIEGMIFYVQNYTSKYSSGQDLLEYMFNTC